MKWKVQLLRSDWKPVHQLLHLTSLPSTPWMQNWTPKTPGGKPTPASYINIINHYAISWRERVSIHHTCQQVTDSKAWTDSYKHTHPDLFSLNNTHSLWNVTRCGQKEEKNPASIKRIKEGDELVELTEATRLSEAWIQPNSTGNLVRKHLQTLQRIKQRRFVLCPCVAETAGCSELMCRAVWCCWCVAHTTGSHPSIILAFRMSGLLLCGSSWASGRNWIWLRLSVVEGTD